MLLINIWSIVSLMLTEIYSHYLRIHKGREDSGDEISIAIHT